MTAHELVGEGGTITITSAALTQLVVNAAESAPGARVRRPRRGLDIEIADDRARVELELAAPRRAVLPDLGADVQRRVAEALEGMCGLGVSAVDVSIEELDD